MNIGYARTSTVDQLAGLEAQLIQLKASGCEKIYYEQISSSAKKRTELKAAIDFVREGDVLVITKIDRLARSVTDLLQIIDVLKTKKVEVWILNLGMDTQTPTGQLMLVVLAGVAQFEREIMLERQREGVAKAKAQGKYKGRKPISIDKQKEIKALIANGASKVSIAKKLKIGEATVYRILKSSTKQAEEA
jgi:DNA invertase Pin-like site-specific DNA recombinase